MAVNVSVATDNDIYDVLLKMQEASGASISQQANKLMRNGYNYQNIRSDMAQMENKIDAVLELMSRYLEVSGHGELIEEVESSHG